MNLIIVKPIDQFTHQAFRFCSNEPVLKTFLNEHMKIDEFNVVPANPHVINSTPFIQITFHKKIRVADAGKRFHSTKTLIIRQFQYVVFDIDKSQEIARATTMSEDYFDSHFARR